MENIGIIGLGYVGLPLAIAFAKKNFNIIGFDINKARINELNNNIDSSLSIKLDDLKKQLIKFSFNDSELDCCSTFIITVPTPINSSKQPDTKALFSALKTTCKYLKKNDLIIIESTVYPGFTDEEAIPLIEKLTNFKINVDFFVGYSPERMNPGDPKRGVENIIKVCSGSNLDTLKKVSKLYSQIVTVGIHSAPTIKVAEAAKIIENTQRDINIAFINELSMIFNKMNIDTYDVLEAAGTKWNFQKFTPGLVGGHCIGVDPYYLAHQARKKGHIPDILLAGRRINESMSSVVAYNLIKAMAKKGLNITKSKILILGITFKENCPDPRNTKVLDIVSELKNFNCSIDIYDPVVDKNKCETLYDIELKETINIKDYNGIILAVSHNQFKVIDFSSRDKNMSVLYDLKGLLPKDLIDLRL